MLITRSLLESTSWPTPSTRHAVSVGPEGLHFTSPSPLADDTSDPDDSIDTDEEDVDFWGGQSPRSRLSSPNTGHEMPIDESEEDEDESEDEQMGDDDDDVEGDEADDYNRMDILGHR